MTKSIASLVFAAAFLAAAAGVAGAADYPPCKSRSDDKCMQVQGNMMHEMKSKKGEMKSMGSRENMEKSMAPSSGSAIPHGCSPATTPCQ